MKDFDETWTRAEAIQALFFWDRSTYPSSVGEERVRQLISTAFENMPLRSIALSALQERTLRQAVEAVKTSMPYLTAISVVHPVLWARWALRSGLPIDNRFWRHFSQWRATNRPSVVKLMQYGFPGSKPWRGRVRAAQGSAKLVGYTVDQILAQEKFAFDEYMVQWRIKRVQFATVVERRPAPRAVETVCGQEAMRVLGECIRTEAEAGTLGLLSSMVNDGKYTSTVPPAELLQRLKSRHPAIARYSNSTLTRGLSAFVRCPRGRPGGLRSSPS